LVFWHSLNFLFIVHATIKIDGRRAIVAKADHILVSENDSTGREEGLGKTFLSLSCSEAIGELFSSHVEFTQEKLFRELSGSSRFMASAGKEDFSYRK
jgi:hypothetical protein